MKKAKTGIDSTPHPPARTPEGREKQLVALAMVAAEKQLRDGTASAQVITHFLKLGTETARLERIKLERENELLTAKTDAIKSDKEREQKYEEVVAALRKYSGQSDEIDYSDLF